MLKVQLSARSKHIAKHPDALKMIFSMADYLATKYEVSASTQAKVVQNRKKKYAELEKEQSKKKK